MDETERSWQGRFVGREYEAPDRERAIAFYCALFGWAFDVEDLGPAGTRTVIRAKDHALGTLAPVGATGTGSAAAPAARWTTWISADRLEEAVARATSLGGGVVDAPSLLPFVGRRATVRDPVGATFVLFESVNPGTSDFTGAPPEGSFCWSQHESADPGAASAFYAGLFGWRIAETGGAARIASLEHLGLATFVPGAGAAGWTPFVSVPAVERSLVLATHLGAVKEGGVVTVPGMGAFAVLRDPAGARFALFENRGAWKG